MISSALRPRLRLVGLAALAALVFAGAALAQNAAPKGRFGPVKVTHRVKRQLRAGDRVVRVGPKGQLPGGGARAVVDLFADDFEGAFPGIWQTWNDTSYVDAGWAPTDYRSAEGTAGTHSLYCASGGTQGVAPPGPYPDDTNTWIIYGPFDLTDAVSGAAAFKLWLDCEWDYDVVFAGYSSDNTWFYGDQWTGSSGGDWMDCSVDMADWVGTGQVYFAIVFSADYSVNAEGAYVDQVTAAADIQPRYELSGLVTDAGGFPLAGTAVTVSPGDQQVYTDFNGHYSVRLPAGDYQAKPTKAGYAFTPATAAVTLGPTTPASRADGDVTNVDFIGNTGTADGVTRYYALVVGISDFDGTANDLQYCDDDAIGVRRALVASGRWDPANVVLLTDADATRANIVAALKTLSGQMDADDVFLLFYSSHGYQDYDEAPYDEPDGYDEYVCTYYLNGDGENLRDDELGTWLNGLPTNRYAAIFDTCFSGGQIRGRVAGNRAAFAAGLAEDIKQGGLATRDLDDNAAGVVISACRDDQYSSETDELQHGVFTYYLLEGFAGPADINHDGWVSAEEAYGYVRPRAQAYNYYQTAELFDAYPGELNLVPQACAVRCAIPGSGANAVPRTKKVTLAFKRRVWQKGAEARFGLYDAQGQKVPGTIQWIQTQTAFTFTPDTPLAAGAQYTIREDWGVKATDNVTVYYQPFASSFTTNSAPLLTAQAPTGDDVAPDAALDLTFDLPMRLPTVLSALSLNGTAASGLGTLSAVGGDKSHLAFTPNTPWVAGTTYNVRLVTSALSQAGARLSQIYTWSFTVADAGGALLVSATASPTGAGPSAITVSLSAAANVSATVCNLAGRPVAALAAQNLPAGLSTLYWNGRSATGTLVPGGRYLLQLRANAPGGGSASCLVPLAR